MGKVVEMKATTQVQDKTIENEIAARKPLYDLVMNNLREVGSKKFSNAPLQLLVTDDRFQRDASSAKLKIKGLVDNWNPNKMDALRVVPHPEAYCFSVIDGGHRLEAKRLMGDSTVECEIILGLSSNPVERLKEEAFLFATQDVGNDPLYAIQKHPANLICGVRENVIVDSICNKYHVPLKKSLRGKTKTAYLAGFSEALSIAKVHGENMFDNIMYILCESRWNLSNKGLCSDILRMLRGILRLHPEQLDVIIPELVNYFTPIDPSQYISMAHAKYPERKKSERLVLLLEDHLVETLHIERVYNGGPTFLTKAA